MPKTKGRSDDRSKNSYSVRYRFSQPFDFPAVAAYRWCTDYQPDDWALMGEEGTRKIEHINEDTLILTDTVTAGKDGPVTKERLVRLNPERLAWTNTHLAGPNKHSQFWYQIVEGEGRGKKRQGSRLEFTGLQVYHGGAPPSPEKLAKMADRLVIVDSGAWKLLAEEMRKDLGKQDG
ncbi:MAG: hypothetical protein ABSF83_03530 [Nitrososphaerales archaeon]